MGNKYDPLWEYAGIKLPLQGTDPDIDARCPVCHVTVHLGLEARANQAVECGLCGAQLEVITEGDALILREVA